MPSRKQRRRRAKERRHEYETVYLDAQGREVEPPPEEAEQRAARTNGKPAAAKAQPKSHAGKQGTKAGSVRVVPPPSWQRVAKRGAIFAPFMFITLYLLAGTKNGYGPILIQTVWLLLLFIPFSYLVDRMMYRRYLRQTGQLKEEPRKAKPKKS
jgi:hypothetical protein